MRYIRYPGKTAGPLTPQQYLKLKSPATETKSLRVRGSAQHCDSEGTINILSKLIVIFLLQLFFTVKCTSKTRYFPLSCLCRCADSSTQPHLPGSLEGWLGTHQGPVQVWGPAQYLTQSQVLDIRHQTPNSELKLKFGNFLGEKNSEKMQIKGFCASR